jgi:hypothetical protein
MVYLAEIASSLSSLLSLVCIPFLKARRAVLAVVISVAPLAAQHTSPSLVFGSARVPSPDQAVASQCSHHSRRGREGTLGLARLELEHHYPAVNPLQQLLHSSSSHPLLDKRTAGRHGRVPRLGRRVRANPPCPQRLRLVSISRHPTRLGQAKGWMISDPGGAAGVRSAQRRISHRALPPPPPLAPSTVQTQPRTALSTPHLHSGPSTLSPVPDPIAANTSLEGVIADVSAATGLVAGNVLIFTEDGRELRQEVLEELWERGGHGGGSSVSPCPITITLTQATAPGRLPLQSRDLLQRSRALGQRAPRGDCVPTTTRW